MAQSAHHQPLRRRPAGPPDSWNNANPRRDAWEERPREIAFWTIPLVVTMITMAIIILYFSFAS
jgi:hypothetical protein